MRPDVTWLRDMLQFSRELVEFTTGVTWAQYTEDLMRRRAVERTVEILGEAAKRVSAEFRAAHPEVEWREIAGARDVLAHQYSVIDHDVLWTAATIHAPRLIATLQSLLQEPE